MSKYLTGTGQNLQRMVEDHGWTRLETDTLLEMREFMRGYREQKRYGGKRHVLQRTADDIAREGFADAQDDTIERVILGIGILKEIYRATGRNEPFNALYAQTVHDDTLSSRTSDIKTRAFLSTLIDGRQVYFDFSDDSISDRSVSTGFHGRLHPWNIMEQGECPSRLELHSESSLKDRVTNVYIPSYSGGGNKKAPSVLGNKSFYIGAYGTEDETLKLSRGIYLQLPEPYMEVIRRNNDGGESQHVYGRLVTRAHNGWGHKIVEIIDPQTIRASLESQRPEFGLTGIVEIELSNGSIRLPNNFIRDAQLGGSIVIEPSPSLDSFLIYNASIYNSLKNDYERCSEICKGLMFHPKNVTLEDVGRFSFGTDNRRVLIDRHDLSWRVNRQFGNNKDKENAWRGALDDAPLFYRAMPETDRLPRRIEITDWHPTIRDHDYLHPWTETHVDAHVRVQLIIDENLKRFIGDGLGEGKRLPKEGVKMVLVQFDTRILHLINKGWYDEISRKAA